MAVDMAKVTTWVRQADAIFQTPLVALTLVPLLKSILPSLGVTPAQIAQLDAHYDDLVTREAEARRRAVLHDDDGA
jgi:hypothetical protein